MKYLCVLAIKFYQNNLRQFHNRECIYTPSCSTYAILAIEKYGVIKGTYNGMLRIRRCNGALYQGGHDHP